MTRLSILACGIVGLAAAAEPDKSGIKVLTDEIASTKRFMEPWANMVGQLSKGLSAVSKNAVPTIEAMAKKDAMQAMPAAELKLKSQATNLARKPAPAAPKPAKQGGEVKAFAAKGEAKADHSAKPAAEIPPLHKVQWGARKVAPVTIKEKVKVSAQEHRKLWTLLNFNTPNEMVMLSKLASEQNLGAKYNEWCKDAASPFACKYETNVKQYCTLLRYVVPRSAETVAAKTVMKGMLETEADRLNSLSKNLEALNFLQQSAVSGPADDAGTWDDIIETAAFETKLDDMCQSLQSLHPGCRTVAEEIALCQVIGDAAVTLSDSDRLVGSMVDAFLRVPELQMKPAV